MALDVGVGVYAVTSPSLDKIDVPKGRVVVRIETVRLVDDLTGGPADETVDFAVDGARYEIDLTSEHAATLREALAPYIGAGRQGQPASSPRRGRRTGTSSPMSTERREHNNAVRAWARQQGYKVSTSTRCRRHRPLADARYWL